MSLMDCFRARWKHPDAEIRKRAVGKLKDAMLLCHLAETDPNQDVRAAAFRRLTDESFLVLFAKGTGAFNLQAVARLTEPRHLIDVAQHAADPQARLAAVARIDDPLVLHQVATLDVSPEVRRWAKRKDSVPECTREHLKAALSKLEIAEPMAGGVTEYGGTLNEVCGAIVADGRFELHGIVTGPATGEPGDQLPHAAETMAPFSMTARMPRSQFVELLGGRHLNDGPSGGGTQPLFYRIKIWRLGENDFRGSLEERRISMTRDVEAWGQSSGSNVG